MKSLPSLEVLIFSISCFVLVAHRFLIRAEILILNPSTRWRWPPFPEPSQPPLLSGEHPSSANHTASFQNGAVLLVKFEMMNLRLDCMICCIYNKLTSFKAETPEKSTLKYRIIKIVERAQSKVNQFANLNAMESVNMHMVTK